MLFKASVFILFCFRKKKTGESKEIHEYTYIDLSLEVVDMIELCQKFVVPVEG